MHLVLKEPFSIGMYKAPDSQAVSGMLSQVSAVSGMLGQVSAAQRSGNLMQVLQSYLTCRVQLCICACVLITDIVLQACIRGRLARQNLARCRGACITMQAHWRGQTARRRAARIRATIVVQKHVRRRQCRRLLAAQHRAAMQIQVPLPSTCTIVKCNGQWRY